MTDDNVRRLHGHATIGHLTITRDTPSEAS